MDSLQDTEWDVLIAGTGLQQSLLALYVQHLIARSACLTDAVCLQSALSRAGRKVLHVDRNDYYGGSEAALNLADVDKWAAQSGCTSVS